MMSRREPRRPRVLYLAFYFPPSRASGVYRARATANYLAANGWDVTTCAAPLKFLHEVIGSVDEGLAATVDPRIRIERPALSQFAWERDLRRMGRFRRTSPVLTRNLYNWGLRHLFPEHYSSWGMAAVARALRLHARRRFDVVLATGNPFASFASAWLFNRLTGVPYAVDYRDAWTLNMFTEEPAYEEGHLVWGWERRILHGASAAVFVNRPLQQWYAARYPAHADRLMVVPNGWDPDVLTDVRPAVAATGPDEHRPLRFGFLGTINNTQPVEELVAAFHRARQHPELADAELNIHGHLGYFRDGQSEMMNRLGLPADAGPGTTQPGSSGLGIRYHGPVSKTEVGRVYRENDVLVFLAGGARYVTSGKIFEYMASGRPIVSVHAPGIAAQDVLEGYPLWFNANSLDVEEIAQSMIAAGKAARDLTPDQQSAARAHGAAFARETVLAPLEARLRSIAAGHSRSDVMGS
jgi:glycosyltransferase involved in cell wall biosynthesis